MATIFMKDETDPKKRVMDKRAVRKLLERRDEQIESLKDTIEFYKACITEAKSRMFKAEKHKQIAVGLLTFVLITFLFLMIMGVKCGY